MTYPTGSGTYFPHKPKEPKVTNVWYEVEYKDETFGWTRSLLSYGSPEEAKEAWPRTYADGDLKIFQVVTTESEVVE